MLRPKKVGKNLLCWLLERQVLRLRRDNELIVVAVVGSVGKTSTKLAIARTLQASQAVIYQDGNYNDRLTVPLVLFGHRQPGLFNLWAWVKILGDIRRQLRRPYRYSIAVLELGTDAPGQLEAFAYLRPDILVITAIAAEHMEFFGDLDAVAREELTPVEFSKKIILNDDDIDQNHRPTGKYLTYGLSKTAGIYCSARHPIGPSRQSLTIQTSADRLSVETSLLGDQGAKAALAAVAVADSLGWSPGAIKRGLQAIEPVPGRMRVLSGKHGAVIIDDSYNASPIAVRAALNVLYQTEAKHKIAILGSMNELGSQSAEEHRQIGLACDSSQLDWVVTIGALAKQQLAPSAQAAGCRVKSFADPYQAGHFVAELLNKDTVVLAKGSQNGVFAEEAVKLLLKNSDDARLLVRQSTDWLGKKQKQFKI